MRSIFISILLILTTFASNAQVISTYAGNGIRGLSGDGGPATNAEMYYPYGVALDRMQNIYISEIGNSRIRKVNALTGTITTFAGTSLGFSGDGGLATNAQLNWPRQIAIDVTGNLYIADYANRRIRKVDTSGIITTVAGTGILGDSGDGGPATNARFTHPYSVAVDSSGNLFVVDYSANRVRKINYATGIITTVAGNGTAGYSGDGFAATGAQLNEPAGVAVDKHGNLFICDYVNYRLRKVDTGGIITTIAGIGTMGYSGDGGAATLAQFNYLIGVFIDQTDNIYVADQLVVRKVNTSGIITTVAGNGLTGFSGDGGLATAASLYAPTSIAVSPLGVVYIADYANNRVRKVTPEPAPYFLRGNTQYITVCGEFVLIDTLLSVVDSDMAQTATWSIASPPAHGTAVVAYSAATTGGVIVTTGLSYAPATGYYGLDTFKVQVNDGYKSDTTIIYVTILQLPNAGTISGPDTVCIGDTVALSDTTTGGSWSTTSPHASVSGGLIFGISAGTATISYTLSNPCGIATATKNIYISGNCYTAINSHATSTNGTIAICPNPNNGRFTLSFVSATKEKANVIVTNLLGEKLMETTVLANKAQTLTLDQPSGIYFISVITENEIWNSKVVVSR
jgi:sugar lactone lactonase YvrE